MSNLELETARQAQLAHLDEWQARERNMTFEQVLARQRRNMFMVMHYWLTDRAANMGVPSMVAGAESDIAVGWGRLHKFYSQQWEDKTQQELQQDHQRDHAEARELKAEVLTRRNAGLYDISLGFRDDYTTSEDRLGVLADLAILQDRMRCRKGALNGRQYLLDRVALQDKFTLNTWSRVGLRNALSIQGTGRAIFSRVVGR